MCAELTGARRWKPFGISAAERVTYADLHRWKAKPGYNDDWRMTADWVTSLGTPTTYEQAQAAFNGFYWGTAERRGNVRNEKLLISPRQIATWAKRYELNLFTGRNRREFSFTFDRWAAAHHFRMVITMDDVTRIASRIRRGCIKSWLAATQPLRCILATISTMRLRREMLAWRSWPSLPRASTVIARVLPRFANWARWRFAARHGA